MAMPKNKEEWAIYNELKTDPLWKTNQVILEGFKNDPDDKRPWKEFREETEGWMSMFG